ncbi:hypothetical protein GS429_02290 [Natronorubrum sp. JWXQ-INN-674]|uniref:Uncharacterized protein n=1 Tax=Natronorubrum halalkaliphilum TaxID=2691917 RepID=A0A6B0VHA6_9EURY|nr:hypothetical protein [Natronorubrum halalkaliphilum]MXV60920.1 hypothetical protein [Natronorubrum halalkaliphilum]
MDEDAPADSADSDTIQWRRDASTSRTVRLLWSLGVGTFFAAIVIIAVWRVYDLAAQTGNGSIAVAFFAALAATILALIASSNTERHLEALTRRLPVGSPSGDALERVMNAVTGTVVMIGVIGTLMAIGRFVSRRELLGELGAGPFTGLAALLIPIALVALVLASFLRSVGTLDREERAIYLYDPDQRVDLEVIEGVSSRRFGDATILKLEYAEPDGQYVAGPRRIVVPPAVAQELQSLVEYR